MRVEYLDSSLTKSVETVVESQQCLAAGCSLLRPLKQPLPDMAWSQDQTNIWSERRQRRTMVVVDERMPSAR